MVFERTADHLRVLEFGAESDGPTQSLETTDEHPFWSVEAKNFVAAGDLRLGDRFISPAGEFSTLTATHRDEHPEGVAVYNFEVADVHNYYVRAHGLRAPPVRVHNAPGGLCGGTVRRGKVYRGLADGEDISNGLTARRPGAGNSEISHVAGKRPSQWISTTKSLEVAKSKFGRHGVVEIDLSQIQTRISDVSDGFRRTPGMISNWAKKFQEVLILDHVPPEAITRIW